MVGREKATTFAAALREKPTTDLRFTIYSFTIERLKAVRIKKLSFYFEKGLAV